MAFDNKYGNPNIEGIPEDEPVFILRAQDKVALDALDSYADLAEMEGVSKEFLEGVNNAIKTFETWQESHDTKIPD